MSLESSSRSSVQIRCAVDFATSQARPPRTATRRRASNPGFARRQHDHPAVTACRRVRASRGSAAEQNGTSSIWGGRSNAVGAAWRCGLARSGPAAGPCSRPQIRGGRSTRRSPAVRSRGSSPLDRDRRPRAPARVAGRRALALDRGIDADGQHPGRAAQLPPGTPGKPSGHQPDRDSVQLALVAERAVGRSEPGRVTSDAGERCD
jgi:hypothetical protein